jgi:hypothetical protein
LPMLIDLTGKKFNRLTVLRRADHNKGTDPVWVCRCDCEQEREVEVRGSVLRDGRTQSCGCLRSETSKKRNRNRAGDFTGLKFGQWTVLSQAPNRGQTRYWLCVCACPAKTQKEVSISSLATGASRSCGCLRIPASKHPRGRKVSAEYRLWRRLINRCHNPDYPGYAKQGGIGLQVCASWRNSFDMFFSDMGPKPAPAHTIDRQDRDADYTPENCLWVKSKEKNKDRRRTHWLRFGGEKKTVAGWARMLGIPDSTLEEKLERSQTLEGILAAARHLPLAA